MSTAVFFPYRTGTERILLDVRPSDLGIPVGGDGAVLLYQCEETPDFLRLEISASVPESVIKEFIPPGETGSPPVTVILLCRSKESRKRFPIVLEGDEFYSTELELKPGDWSGTLTIQATVVRNTALSPAIPGYGSDNGSILAWSDEKRVLFDPPLTPPSDHIEVLWEKFSESLDSWRRRHADNLFALDMSKVPPVLYLNEDVSGAKTIFSSMGTHGTHARIRDASFYMIAHQVWSSLLTSAFSELQNKRAAYGEEIVSPDTVMKDLLDWESRILKDWSRYMFPESDPVTSLEDLVELTRTGEGIEKIMERMPNVIQTRLRTYRGFEGMVKEFVRI